MPSMIPRNLRLQDGTTWPTPEPVKTLHTGLSWRLRHRHPKDLHPCDIDQAAEIIHAYSRLCLAEPAEREHIIGNIKTALDNTTHRDRDAA